ncbi:MAG: hypothetical protein EOO07_19910 [Chitinophagaceae bacterium]|nr:MAG: hypothetical protein EOO07_19910 [Chitinophagaceae bacterium]
MKKFFIAALATIVFLYACNPSGPDKTDNNGEDLEKTTTFAFSDTTKLDTFKVALIGKDSKDMQLQFTIKSFEGKEIYKQEIKASELLKNYLATAEMKKESDKIQFLKEEIAYFFDEKHFLEPAVTPEEQADKNVPDKAFYEELRKSGLNGFDYRLSKDSNVYIAWSAKEKKVKVYYKCC